MPLDPEVALLLRQMMPQGAPPLDTLPPQVVRAGVAAWAAASQVQPAVGQVRTIAIDGPGGALPLRIYQPENPRPRAPLVIYLHGGGFVLCDLETHDDICRQLCVRLAAVVVSVDYRLAPEHPFPAAIDDALAATRWAAANALALGADPARVAVMGDSAGGTLTLAVALRCASEQGPSLRMMAPIYPATDLREPSIHGSRERLGTGEYGMSARDLRWFTQQYLRSAEDAEHPWASPLLASDLAGLPPCVLVTAEFDPLKDEGAALADALAAAGVDVRYRCFARMPHGFFGLGAAPAAGRAFAEITALVAELLEGP
jgi:acetyl esterase